MNEGRSHGSPFRLQCGDGLGVLPVKAIVHYSSDYKAPHVNWEKAEELLRAYKEELPVMILAEGEFVVRTIDD